MMLQMACLGPGNTDPYKIFPYRPCAFMPRSRNTVCSAIELLKLLTFTGHLRRRSRVSCGKYDLQGIYARIYFTREADGRAVWKECVSATEREGCVSVGIGFRYRIL
jgi:hypothetical protein